MKAPDLLVVDYNKADMQHGGQDCAHHYHVKDIELEQVLASDNAEVTVGDFLAS